MSAHTPLWKLRRLAPRALRVQDRHRDKEAGLAAFDHTMVISAKTLMTTYDGLRTTDSARSFERAEGLSTLKSLHLKLRVWGAHVADRVPGVDASTFGDNPDVLDDVITDAQVLVKRVEEHAAQASEPLPFKDELVADLTAAIEAASGEAGQTENVTAEVAALRVKTHEAAEAFERDLVSYRKALAAVIGRNHPDYQKLRADRARTPDEDDDANAPESGAPEPVGDNVTPLPTNEDATEEAATP